jgi:multiple sugar transport system ATP-binding protein
MNFIPCRLEESDGGLRVRLGDNIALPVPASRAGRYKPYVGRDGLTFGLRPEHLTEAKSEAKSNGSGEHALIDATLEVTEPLGMETLVFFHINGVDVCARVSPNAGAREGVRMKLDARLENMHLIDDTTGRVL